MDDFVEVEVTNTGADATGSPRLALRADGRYEVHGEGVRLAFSLGDLARSLAVECFRKGAIVFTVTLGYGSKVAQVSTRVADEYEPPNGVRVEGDVLSVTYEPR